MTYHKRPLQTRRCAHCDAAFEAAHKSRLYCCQSCNTLAWRARQTGRPTSRALAGTDDPAALPPLPLGLVAAGAALGSLGAQAATYVAQQLTQGGSSAELLLAEVRQLRQDLGLAPATPPAVAPAGVAPPAPPRTFLPPALASTTAPVVQLTFRSGAPQAFVRLDYHGHVLYHQADQHLLLWACAPDQYRRILAAPGLAALAAHPRPPAGAPLALAPAAPLPGVPPTPLPPPATREAPRPAAGAQTRAARGGGKPASAPGAEPPESPAP